MVPRVKKINNSTNHKLSYVKLIYVASLGQN